MAAVARGRRATGRARRSGACALFALLLVAACALGAQPTGRLAGRVLSAASGRPVAQAILLLRNRADSTAEFRTTTSATGDYAFDVPGGTYTLYAFALGYARTSVRIELAASSTIHLDLLLPEQNLSENQVAVMPASSYFNLSEPNFFLLGFQDFRGNQPVGGTAYANQIKFRVALRYRFLSLSRRLDSESGLHAAYRQNSFWNLWEDSAPFFDNNYNPQLFAYWDARDHWASPWAPSLSAFVEHESNGRDGAASRSWNRYGLGAEFGDYRTDPFFGSVRAWRAFSVAPENIDLRDFAGRGEVDFSWQPFARNQVLLGSGGISARLRVGGRPFLTNSEIDGFLGTFGRLSRLNLSLMGQWFQGTGETLLDYRTRRSVFRVGFATVR